MAALDFPASPTVGQTTADGRFRWNGVGWVRVKTPTVLGISQGGTGATTAAGARTNLGIDALTWSFRNKLINSDFSVNQRAVSGTVTLSAGSFGHDRWRAGSSGCTYTFSTSNNVTTITITAGSLQQVVEGLRLATGTYVLSWTGSAQGRIASGSYGATGVTASVTGGTNTTIEFGTGTLTLPQFEPGSTATTVEPIPAEFTLAGCKRYFQAYYGASTGGATFAARGAPGGGNGIYFNSVLQVEMRAAPTATVVGTFTTSNCGQPVLNAATKNTITLVGNCAANGDAYFFSTSTSVGFTLNAELP